MTAAFRETRKSDMDRDSETTVRVGSIGAGKQSTTLVAMAIRGEIQMDYGIFADTQSEPPSVYRNLDFITNEAVKAGIPIYVVTVGNLQDDAIAGVSAAWMPLFSRDPKTGKLQQLKRQCTRNYKIRPIRRKIRELGGGSLVRGRTVEQTIGISLDEFQRMRDSDVKYIRNVYPLVDLRMTRNDCTDYLKRIGWPDPPKSACTACPYHDDAYWRETKAERPDDFAAAVAFDHAIRDQRSQRDQAVFVHRSCVPLDMVDLRTAADHGQTSMFDEECSGVCGV